MSDATISILITDDEAQNQSELAYLLQLLNKNVSIQKAINGDMALKLVLEKIERTGTSFNLIFMDFKMPGMNGEDTTTAIRKLETQMVPHDPSIIITWSSAKTAAYPNANDWLPKPPSKEEVHDLLMKYGVM